MTRQPSAQSQNKSHDWGWLAALLLPLLGILPTFNAGIMNAADAPLHVQRIFAMGSLLGTGELYPRWVSWFHLGYGYPIFNFYPPGVFYAGGVLMQFGVSAVMAFHLIAAAAWISGTLGAYRLGRLLLPGYAAIIAAALWAYAPSRFFEVWHQGSLPQIVSASFIPWVLYHVIRGAKHPTRRTAGWLALSLAGMILTHQPTTFISALFVAPLTVLIVAWYARHAWETLWNRARCVYGGILLGALLSAIFLIPVFAELSLVDAAGGTDDVIPFLITNFLTPRDVVVFPLPPDVTDIRQVYPETLGLIGSALFTLGILALIRQRRLMPAFLLAAGLTLTVLMLLEISLPIWLTLPYLEQLRTPSRFLRMGATLLAVGGGAALLWLPQRRYAPASAAAVALIMLLALPLTYPTQRWITYPDMSPATNIVFENETFTWGTTSYNEFNPVWGTDIPLDKPANPQLYADYPGYIDVRNSPNTYVAPYTLRVELDEPQTLHFRQFYYPGWTAQINGERVDLYPETRHGLIAIDAPAGESTIQLRYRGTFAQRTGTIITLASLVAILGLFQTGKAVAAPAAAPVSRSFAVSLGATAVILGLLNTFWIIPQTDWFRVRSNPDQPRYMQTEQRATFGDAFELLGYTLEKNTVNSDFPLPITLYWRPLRAIDETYRPVVQIVNLPVTETWAVSQPFFPGGGHSYGDDYTPDRFTSDPHDLRLFDFAKPYAAQIMVQMFDADTDTPILRPDGSDRVLLDTIIYVDVPTPNAVKRLDYTFENGIELWCKSIERRDDQFDITLYWHLSGDPIADDLRTFVHALDALGGLITQADQPPIPEYPTSLWRTKQTVASSYTLPASDQIQTIAIGLYREDGSRLTITQDGQPVPQSQIPLPLLPSDCTTGS